MKVAIIRDAKEEAAINTKGETNDNHKGKTQVRLTSIPWIIIWM